LFTDGVQTIFEKQIAVSWEIIVWPWPPFPSSPNRPPSFSFLPLLAL